MYVSTNNLIDPVYKKQKNGLLCVTNTELCMSYVIQNNYQHKTILCLEIIWNR